jgi:hypothetical protein
MEREPPVLFFGVDSWLLALAVAAVMLAATGTGLVLSRVIARRAEERGEAESLREPAPPKASVAQPRGPCPTAGGTSWSTPAAGSDSPLLVSQAGPAVSRAEYLHGSPARAPAAPLRLRRPIAGTAMTAIRPAGASPA